MPRCGSCSRNYDDPGVMELVRNQENRWVAICRNCLDQGVDVNQVVQGNIAVDEHALQTADKPVIDVTLSGDPFENAGKLLESLRNLRQSKERVGRARTHERKQVEMVVHYTLARDDTRHEGTVKDFSQSGLRVVTSQNLPKGQIVHFDWNIPLPPSMARVLQSAAEVRRITKTDDGLYDIGFKFLARQSDKGANRRRFRRYKCDMLVLYQREGDEIVSSGKVRDISQGGCQMRLDENLASGEVFKVRLVGGGGARGDLVGTMRVCRVVPRDDIIFETGCAFDQMRMEQPPGLSPKSA